MRHTHSPCLRVVEKADAAQALHRPASSSQPAAQQQSKANVSQAKQSSLNADELGLDELLNDPQMPMKASTAIAKPVSKDQDSLEDWLNNL